MAMSIPYETTGRTRQKARTRAARCSRPRASCSPAAWLPTVERAAEHAGVSRTTAYGLSQSAVAAAGDLSDGRRRLTARRHQPAGRSAERLEIVTHAIGEQLLDHEAELRAMLRLSLDPANRAELPLRAGRAIGWIEDALSPLRDTLSKRAPARALDPRDARDRVPSCGSQTSPGYRATEPSS